jgi:hypothetical protein
VAGASHPATPREDQVRQLNRLRDEVGALRRHTNELASLREENRQLRFATDESDDPAEADFKQETLKRTTHLKQWGLSFFLYAKDHNGQFPANFEQAASVQQMEPLLDFSTNNFEIVYSGPVERIANASETLLFREKQARRSPKGGWVKVYGLADGSTITHAEPDEANFAAWEKQRLVAP